MIDPNSGKPVKLVNAETTANLGIKTEIEMQQRIEDYPTQVLGNVITGLFDATPIPSRNLFSIYNEITIDIRKTRQKGESHIEITRDSLEKFKKIFADNPPPDPANNRSVGFILECVDIALAKAIVKPTPSQN